MKARTAAVLACAALLAACAPSTGSGKEELVAADKALTARAAKDGPKAALLATMSHNLKLLDQYNTGALGVQQSFMQLPDNVQLAWEPSFADVATQGDLGYTWGRYLLTLPTTGPKRVPHLDRGYYVNVWKREHGQWRLVFTGSHRDTR